MRLFCEMAGYFKPMVHTPKNLQVAPDAVFQGYMGGAGTKFFKSYADYHPQQHVADICQMEDLVVMAAALDVSCACLLFLGVPKSCFLSCV